MTTLDYLDISKQFNVDVPTIKAVIRVESSGFGFFTDWDMKQRIKIQFEPTHFVKQCKLKGIKATILSIGKNTWAVYANGKLILRNGVEGQQSEWTAFNKAWTVSPECAMLATSWGIGQVMGFNFSAAGYKNVSDMVESFKSSEVNQFIGMMNFIEGDGLLSHLQKHEWTAFAMGYNGPAFNINKYDIKLAQAYKEFSTNFN